MRCVIVYTWHKSNLSNSYIVNNIIFIHPFVCSMLIQSNYTMRCIVMNDIIISWRLSLPNAFIKWQSKPFQVVPRKLFNKLNVYTVWIPDDGYVNPINHSSFLWYIFVHIGDVFSFFFFTCITIWYIVELVGTYQNSRGQHI